MGRVAGKARPLSLRGAEGHGRRDRGRARGVRISPGNPYNGMDPSDPVATFIPFLDAADALGLAYVHVVDMALAEFETTAMVREHWSGPVIANNNLKPGSASALVAERKADAIRLAAPSSPTRTWWRASPRTPP